MSVLQNLVAAVSPNRSIKCFPIELHDGFVSFKNEHSRTERRKILNQHVKTGFALPAPMVG